MLTLGSISVAISGCGNQEPEVDPENPESSSGLADALPAPDLSDAIGKRIEGKPKDAVKLLRKLNEQHPNSPEILLQLGRSLYDSQQFALAAFRLDQALSAGAEVSVLKEAAEAHLQSGDEQSATTILRKYLLSSPDDASASLDLGRLLAKSGDETDALNALSKGSELAEHSDCMLMADLFYKKKLLVQAEHWYREAARREKGITVGPLLGLLRVKLFGGDLDNAETLILAIEKSSPGAIAETDVENEASELLRKRRFGDFIERGVTPGDLTITELAAALLSEKPTTDAVVAVGPKLAPASSEVIEQPVSLSEADMEEAPTLSDPEFIETPTGFGLADAFAAPLTELNELDPMEEARAAYLNRNYPKALNFARQAIKLNPSNSDAWRLSSQAHFQLGESQEAEMTILEAIRHNPLDLETHLDYLRIARETLSSSRYLAELEKVHEHFPESTEIIWQLARRYHLVERMPATATVLYRKLLKTAPEGSALHHQAEMELIKLRNP